ncbi:hypothetical protein [Porphyromonas gingivalis]|uniref:Uncharacterized protein n=1 Tax=Porphyromonas gingivalis TaxID=837 RepID=A0AAE9XKG0_PORGN|nr:hypothetical protein [Porphyromonas gingivalis]WCG03330.1 hypothetical protein NY151_00875 [Porphyromonas gingivalis]
MKYIDKQHIACFSWIESALFYSRSEHTPKGGASYALQRLGLRRRAYLAELYSVARRAVRDSSSSSTAYRHAPYGIAHLSVRTVTLRRTDVMFKVRM